MELGVRGLCVEGDREGLEEVLGFGVVVVMVCQVYVPYLTPGVVSFRREVVVEQNYFGPQARAYMYLFRGSKYI